MKFKMFSVKIKFNLNVIIISSFTFKTEIGKLCVFFLYNYYDYYF